MTVVSGGIKNAPSMTCRVVKNKINRESATVEDEPIFAVQVREKSKSSVFFPVVECIGKTGNVVYIEGSLAVQLVL